MTPDKNETPASPSSQSIMATDSPHCTICGSPGKLLYIGLKDSLFGVQGNFSYRRCNTIDCGLIWQDPMPLAEDLPKAYVNYYTHTEEKKTHGMVGRRLARLPANLLDSLIIRVLGIRKQRKAMRSLGLKGLTPGRMLEVGCGRGERLSLFKEMGWDVSGQEVDIKAVAHVKATRGLDVLYGELTSLGLESEQFDVIVMSHVLEHVLDIRTTLAECFRLLKFGGRLIIATPNADSLGHHKFGKDWRGLEPPRHLHIFSKNNLQAVLYQHGFCRISIKTNAASARGLFEASSLLRQGRVSFKEKYPPTSIYYNSLFFQYKEWLLSRTCPEIGEELFAQAFKQKAVPEDSFAG
jgi:2-polyprenyl-3-methyl-5-hydroxy-6-metoxy-1,4-benzoquinol methylase